MLVNGVKIGTVHLDPARQGSMRARLAPLPSFRSVARHRRAVRTAEELELQEKDLAPAELAALDGAEAVLAALKLTLAVDEDGTEVVAQRLELLKGDPPHLRVTW